MRKLLLSLLIVGMLASPSMAQVGVGANLFQRGRVSGAVSGALGRAFDQDYFVLGAGLAYYIANGLAVGVDGEAWWGDNPNIYKVSPQIRYVFIQSPTIKPYVGVFYRRTFFEGLDDLNSYGGRVGAYTPLGSRGYAGAGIVYEKYEDCNNNLYSSCSSTYPEFTVGVSF